MALVTGKGGVVKIDVASEPHGATTTVGNIRSFSIESSAGTIESTNMDSTARTFITDDLASTTVSIDAYWNDENAGQLLFDAGDEVDLEISPSGTGTGKKYYDVTGTVTGVSITAAFDGMVEASFSVQCSGGKTEQTH